MESQNYLGIHVSAETATVVCLGGGSVVGCFSVSLSSEREKNLGADMSELARLVAAGIAERKLTFGEAAVAVDCSLFMQHSVHSEFTDRKQIAQTVRFDTEDALSSDIAEVSVAFRVVSTDEHGSQLSVFTAQRGTLSAILLGLQANGIDPVHIEPDVDSLSRFARDNVSVDQDSDAVIGFLSHGNGYLMSFAGASKTASVRTFLVGAKQDRSRVLASQIPLTLAALGAAGGTSAIRVFDSAGQIDAQLLAERLGADVEAIDLASAVGSGSEQLSDCADAVGFAVAYGAARTHSQKAGIANFRDDFMPYEGKKQRLEKTIKFLGVSVGILMISLGIYLTSLLMQVNKYRGELKEKFEPQYTTVMRTRSMPQTMKMAVGKLDRLNRRIKAQSTGAGGEIPSKVTSLLRAFNQGELAKKTRLQVDAISVSSRMITLAGDTSNRNSTLQLREAIKQANLGSVTERLELAKTGRDSFKMTITAAR